MEINPDMQVTQRLQPAISGNASEAAGKITDDNTGKPGVKPVEGQTVTGVITDLTPDSVTLSVSTADGEVSITAELRGRAPDAKIGDAAAFICRADDNGELYLEAKPVSDTALQKAVVADALVSAGLKTSPENIKMAMALLENSMPLTKENLLRFNQALKLLGGEKTDEAIFMLKNGLRLGPRSAEALERALTGGDKILNQLAALENAISGLPDSALKERLTALFGGSGTTTDVIGETVKNILSETNPPKAAALISRALDSLPPSELREFVDAMTGRGERQTPGARNEPVALDLPGLKEALAAELERPGAAGPSAGARVNIPDRAPVSSPNAAATDIIAEAVNTKLRAFELIDSLFNEHGAELLQQRGEGAVPNREILANVLKALGAADIDSLAPNIRAYIERRLMGEDGSAAARPGRTRFEPRGGGPEEIDRFLNELRESISDARNELIRSSPQTGDRQGGGSAELSNIMKTLTDIDGGLNLAAQLKNTMLLQLPLMINGHETNSELYVFKDSTKKKKSGATTALIALDTANLDRLETYIQKEGASVTLQFRVKSDEVKNTLSRYVNKLSDQLTEHGHILQAYSFRLLTENFTLLSDPDELLREPPSDSHGSEHAKGERRLAFDVRL